MKQLFCHRQSGMISRVHDIDQQQHFGQVHLPVWTQRFTAPDWKRRQQHRIHQVIQAALLPQSVGPGLKTQGIWITKTSKYLRYCTWDWKQLYFPQSGPMKAYVYALREKKSFRFKLLFWEDSGFSFFTGAFCLVGSCSQASKERRKQFSVHKCQMSPYNLSPNAHLILRQSRYTISRGEI